MRFVYDIWNQWLGTRFNEEETSTPHLSPCFDRLSQVGWFVTVHVMGGDLSGGIG